MGLFRTKRSPTVPLLIIKKTGDDAVAKEIASMEEALAALQRDPNVSHQHVETLLASLARLKKKAIVTFTSGQK